MKIVIVSQCIYPSLSPRSHRATQLAKELSNQGHNVTLYALLGDYDYSKFTEGKKLFVKNLGTTYGLVNSSGVRKTNFFIKVLTKLLYPYIMFPDILLFRKIKKAVRNEGEIDLLITVAVPYINHFAVSFMNRDNIKCWISDCGDPLMGNPFCKYPFYFKYFEKRWCKNTDFITVPISSSIEAYYKEYRDKIFVVPQGFDFSDIKLATYKKNRIPTFAFSGAVYNKLRDPSKFLEYLAGLQFDFKFIVYTKTDKIFLKYKEKLGDKLELRNYVDRDILLFELSKMDFLINIQNESSVQSPSKLIDYSLTKRPCLNISSDFNESVDFNNFIRGDYSSQYTVNNIEQYNIKNVVGAFIKLYKKIISDK